MANTFHVSVYVRSIPEAVEHYRKLLGIEPTKVKQDYAKFELEDPPVIFSLSIGGEPGKLSHLGIRYPGTGDVASEMVRVKGAGVPLFQQQGTTCCYAKADKFWVRDEDGIPWDDLQDRVDAMAMLGVPYDAAALRDADGVARDQARFIADAIVAQGGPALADKEIVALIAYLQRLGTDIQPKTEEEK